MAVLADPDRSVAVLVGVHRYAHLDDLPAVARNLDGLAEVLTDPEVWGLPSDRCTVLDQPDSAQEVLDTVREAAHRAKDTLLVYFAGHGLTDPHTEELYLAMPDTDREREYTALRYEYLRRSVLDLRADARRTVVILDCCYSGRALIGRMSASDYVADRAMVEGTCLLTASAETRPALSPRGETHTAFTGELITALREGIPEGPDPIDMDALYRHLHHVLAAKSRPLPQQRNRNTGGRIALARNRSAVPVPVPETPKPLLRRLAGNRLTVSLAVLGVVAAASLGTALTLGDGGWGRPGGGSSAGSHPDVTVTVGVDVPLTGDLAGVGRGARNSADLAVKEANNKKVVDGVTFKISALDDKSMPDTASQNATKLIADESVLGVVGPVNSSIARGMQPVFDDAHLALVSPSALDPALTQGPDWQAGTKSRPFASFFRTVPTDATHGTVVAQYAYNKAGKRRAFVVDDGQTYGTGLASAFQAEFTRLGGKAVGTHRLDPGTEDFSAVAAAVKRSGADLLFYGGTYDMAGPLGAKARQAGADVSLVGGDGIYTKELIELAGAASEGAVTTSLPAPEELDSAKTFLRNYEKSGYGEAHEFISGYAYDATWAIIHAVKEVIDDHDGRLPEDARAKVVDALRHVSFDGATGLVAFDVYGDTTNDQLTVYTVKDGKWARADRGNG
ncbi:caspase, EACC1-associated type [Streptomyces coerulescens]|uniref:ABC transporter substrate-binding protein n=1 Tax=Streptomyces coerulescens TaxID=29304 RepID=A0ABW0CU83_STRCD